MKNYDFSGWATRANMLCSDGRTIMKDAFKHQNNMEVPLVWMHQQNDPTNVLGHALLENRPEGVYAYCTFNDSETGQHAKKLVEHGDVNQLSIHACRLKQKGNNVMHGDITEVSLVLRGANPGAKIESIVSHGEESDEEGIIYTGEDIMLAHSEDDTFTEEEETLEHANENKKTKNNDADENGNSSAKEENINMAEEKKKTEDQVKDESKTEPKGKTVREVWEDILKKTTEEEQAVIYAMIGQALSDKDDEEDVEHSDEIKGGNETMHTNVFDRESVQEVNVLSHADQETILKNAKTMGSLKAAINAFVEDNKDTLAHGFDAENMGKLFPEAEDVYPDAPELIERDNSWVGAVLNKAHKSPAARIRTRHADATAAEARARGYIREKNEGKKALTSGLKAITRTTEPQTIFVRDNLHRDDMLDMDWDMITYQKVIMKHAMEEEVARAALIGDGREDGSADKIDAEKIRPVWGDAPEYTIQALVNTTAMKTKLQGTNTAANFGDEFIFTESVVAAVMDARVKYKGKGLPDFFCAPSTLNKMLLTRDMNGRRIYDSAADLAKVLNVGAIYTMDQMENQERTDVETSKKFKLHGLIVNMGNYTFGSAKGGEITGFEQFDIDFNLLKFLQEARLSGALDHLYSAIEVEEEVTDAAG